jgi:hypothetical protein
MSRAAWLIWDNGGRKDGHWPPAAAVRYSAVLRTGTKDTRRRSDPETSPRSRYQDICIKSRPLTELGFFDADF